MTVSVCTEAPLGGDRRWLLHYGAVTGLTYDTIAPGGPKSLQCNLLSGPNFHGSVVAPGRIVKAFCGAQLVWSGTLDEPTPQADGIALAATGISAEGTTAVVAPATLPSSGTGTAGPGNQFSVDDNLDAAIARGALSWTRTPGSFTVPGFNGAGGTTPGVFGYGDPGGTINDALQAAMDQHAHPWYVLPDGTFFWFGWPTTPSLILTALTPGGGRTRDGMVTDVTARYLNSSGNATMTSFTGNAILRAALGRKEKTLDLTGLGNLTSLTPATNAIAAELAQSGQRAAWTGTFDAPRGLLRTLGGAPVDPATVTAGQMVKVALQDAGQWGESAGPGSITFIVGQTSYDHDADLVKLTPLQVAQNDLAGALRR